MPQHAARAFACMHDVTTAHGHETIAEKKRWTLDTSVSNGCPKVHATSSSAVYPCSDNGWDRGRRVGNKTGCISGKFCSTVEFLKSDASDFLIWLRMLSFKELVLGFAFSGAIAGNAFGIDRAALAAGELFSLFLVCSLFLSFFLSLFLSLTLFLSYPCFRALG